MTLAPILSQINPEQIFISYSFEMCLILFLTDYIIFRKQCSCINNELLPLDVSWSLSEFMYFTWFKIKTFAVNLYYIS
jgi:hypothetical protein